MARLTVIGRLGDFGQVLADSHPALPRPAPFARSPPSARPVWHNDQADMTSVVAIMITILIIGILVDGLFGFANRAIRRRYGLEQVLLQNSCSLGVFASESDHSGVT